MCPPAHPFLFFKDPDSCYTSPFSLSWELLIFNVYCMISLNFINLNFSPVNSSLVRPWELMIQMNFPYPRYSCLSMLQIILNKLPLGGKGNALKIPMSSISSFPTSWFYNFSPSNCLTITSFLTFFYFSLFHWRRLIHFLGFSDNLYEDNSKNSIMGTDLSLVQLFIEWFITKIKKKDIYSKHKDSTQN